MEKINAFVNNFKSVVIIIVASLLVFGFALSRVIPVVQNITKYDADYKSAETSLSDKKRTLENLEAKTKETKTEKVVALKNFYKPIEQGLDSESIIAGAFTHILEIMNDYSIKARSIQYEYQPQDDNFVKNAADQSAYQACFRPLQYALPLLFLCR